MPRVKQKQKQRQSQTVVVNVGAVAKTRKTPNVGNLRRAMFQRITTQNLIDSSRREGVAKALDRLGGQAKLPRHMPYETLERAQYRPSYTINFDIPESSRVSSGPQAPQYARPQDDQRTVRPYLQPDETPRTGARRVIAHHRAVRREIDLEFERKRRAAEESGEESSSSSAVEVPVAPRPVPNDPRRQYKRMPLAVRAQLETKARLAQSPLPPRRARRAVGSASGSPLVRPSSPALGATETWRRLFAKT